MHKNKQKSLNVRVFCQQFVGLLEEAIDLCCYGCRRIRYRKPIASLGAMFSGEMENASYTAIFPILATKSIKTYFTGPFISMMSTPGVSYVKIKPDNGESYEHLLDAISRTWPLLVLSIMLSLNAGFIIWLCVRMKFFYTFFNAKLK